MSFIEILNDSVFPLFPSRFSCFFLTVARALVYFYFEFSSPFWRRVVVEPAKLTASMSPSSPVFRVSFGFSPPPFGMAAFPLPLLETWRWFRELLFCCRRFLFTALTYSVGCLSPP